MVKTEPECTHFDDGFEKGIKCGGEFIGEVTKTFLNGTIFKYKQDPSSGELVIGKLTQPDGTWQEGQFSAVTGRFLSGRVKDQLRDGIYVGDWKNNYPNGTGTLKEKGHVYSGEWKNGEFHGQGILRQSDGDVLSGEWENGNLHGAGKFTSATGNEYVGNFHLGKQHGEGTLYFENGGYHRGRWEKGEIMSGTFKEYTSKTISSGSIINGSPYLIHVRQIKDILAVENRSLVCQGGRKINNEQPPQDLCPLLGGGD